MCLWISRWTTCISWTRSGSTSLLDNLWHSSAPFSLLQRCRWINIWARRTLCARIWCSGEPTCCSFFIFTRIIIVFVINGASHFVCKAHTHTPNLSAVYFSGSWLSWTRSQSTLKLSWSVGLSGSYFRYERWNELGRPPGSASCSSLFFT